MKLLLIEDEKLTRISLTDTLSKAGHQVTACETGIQGLQTFEQSHFDVVISDLRLPGMSGIEVLEKIKKKEKSCTVLIMTAHGSVETAVEALKLGAYDYLTKPFSPDELLNTLVRIQELKKVLNENKNLKQQIAKLSKKSFIGSSKKILRLKETISIIAEGDYNVIIEGESGTGKEVVANEIHNLSSRKNNPFIKVNCSALAESVLESELFGHERGAFTGANQRHIGRFERANNGTIFLDDIDDLPLSIQVKLLRVIQERELERVGGKSTVPLNIRIICATKINLQQAVDKDAFRLDLYYRLNTIKLTIPPLRDHKDDIPLLMDYFLERNNANNSIFQQVQDAAPQILNHSWPGNVRELENFIERVVALSGLNQFNISSLIPEVSQAAPEKVEDSNKFEIRSYKKFMEEQEFNLLKATLEKCNNNISLAAKTLDLPRSTLRSRIEKYEGLI